MTLDEFFTVLEGIDGWKFNCDGAIRRGKTSELECPLVAVAKRESRRELYLGDFYRAGEILGFDRQESLSIANRADGYIENEEAIELRARLLAACKLAEPTP